MENLDLLEEEWHQLGLGPCHTKDLVRKSNDAVASFAHKHMRDLLRAALDRAALSARLKEIEASERDYEEEIRAAFDAAPARYRNPQSGDIADTVRHLCARLEAAEREARSETNRATVLEESVEYYRTEAREARRALKLARDVIGAFLRRLMEERK